MKGQLVLGISIGVMILVLETILLMLFEKTGTTNIKDFISWLRAKLRL